MLLQGYEGDGVALDEHAQGRHGRVITVIAVLDEACRRTTVPIDGVAIITGILEHSAISTDLYAFQSIENTFVPVNARTPIVEEDPVVP